MYIIKTYNKISEAGRRAFDENNYTILDKTDHPDAVIVHSTPLHDMTFAPELKAIVRVGAGVNTIPVDRCTENGIVVFNSPGANANGVKELFVFALSMASRDILGGMNWVYGYQNDEVPVDVAMEQVKKQFAGPEYYGKRLGVIGMGNVGSLVANIALDLGRKVKKGERIARIIEWSDEPLSKTDICNLLPDVSRRTADVVLSKLIEEGRIQKTGSYRDARYIPTE